jgi:hypothetical protein
MVPTVAISARCPFLSPTHFLTLQSRACRNPAKRGVLRLTFKGHKYRRTQPVRLAERPVCAREALKSQTSLQKAGYTADLQGKFSAQPNKEFWTVNREYNRRIREVSVPIRVVERCKLGGSDLVARASNQPPGCTWIITRVETIDQ